METEVLIIGAGLAGLSAAYHLKSHDQILVEAEQKVGGLCRTEIVGGFHFDCTGHLIHFRTPEGRRIITGLLGNQIKEHQRKAAVFLHGCFADYPFQANTFGLPAEIVKDCLLGFIRSLEKKKKHRINNFYDWVQETFGDGIAKHFMVPYNEKLWQHDLHDIALDWVNWSIPKPNLEEVLNGALGIRNKAFGYNPVFYYPERGGIGLLPNSFPVNGNLLLANPVKRIELKKRTATLLSGTRLQYRYLLSTMPLHSLVLAIDDAPATIRNACSRLEYVSVLNINLGIERENVIPYHWVYFPEKDKPFYRIGCASNFSQTVAPPGTSSLFVEISLKPAGRYDIDSLVSDSIAALKRSGILRPEDKIAVVHPVSLPYAYVVYNKERRKAVERIQNYLQSNGVYSFGRYGSWIYSSMEDAVLQGKEFAEKISEAQN